MSSPSFACTESPTGTNTTHLSFEHAYLILDFTTSHIYCECSCEFGSTCVHPKTSSRCAAVRVFVFISDIITLTLLVAALWLICIKVNLILKWEIVEDDSSTLSRISRLFSSQPWDDLLFFFHRHGPVGELDWQSHQSPEWFSICIRGRTAAGHGGPAGDAVLRSPARTVRCQVWDPEAWRTAPGGSDRQPAAADERWGRHSFTRGEPVFKILHVIGSLWMVTVWFTQFSGEYSSQ